MPVFKHQSIFNIARSLKAFLRLEAGLTRGQVPDPERQLAQALKHTAKQGQRMKRLEQQLEKQKREAAALRARSTESAPRTRNPDQTFRQLAQRNEKLAGAKLEDRSAALYLEMVKRSLADAVYGDTEVQGRFPSVAHTMIGFGRLDNLQNCIEGVLADGVPGDLIETGVWRGGATILMRATLEAYGAEDRRVWVADSFEGLPPPDAGKYPEDEGDELHTFEEFQVSVEAVKSNFERYGLLDDQVCFLKGWFRDTLPGAPLEELAVIRLDGDMYESTMDTLIHLYPKLSPGGYLIVDDYGNFPACRQAIHDYRDEHGIDEEIMPIDWSGVYWRRGNPKEG